MEIGDVQLPLLVEPVEDPLAAIGDDDQEQVPVEPEPVPVASE
jgi:hypothetical protein